MAMVYRTCQVCGREYRTHDSLRLKYCSRDCAASGRRVGTVKACLTCGKQFYAHRSAPNRKYCSISCGISARNRTDQNPAYHRDISGEKNPMYGHEGMKGADNPMYGRRKELAPQWSGGRSVRRDGYVFIVAPDDHPFPAFVKRSTTKWMLEHRRVMEQHLGRYLDPHEVVHHIDGNPSNNDISNLRLFASQAEHISIGHGGRADRH